MTKRDRIDAAGTAALTGFALLFAFNQVAIKITNGGLQPVFAAGLRSVGALAVLLLWVLWRRKPLTLARAYWAPGLLVGALFAFEFICLFLALDLTGVARASVIFYSMPVWMALGAHLFLAGDRLTPRRLAGLALAMAGVAWALLDRAEAGAGSLAGDLLALAAAMGWAGTALVVRSSRLVRAAPEEQLFWQLAVSIPLFFLAAPFFGDYLRAFGPLHAAGLAFQVVAIASAGFLAWYWLLTIYPASSVASFSFLSPVFAVLLGWALLGEPVGREIVVALALVSAGLVLVNRPARGQVPQKVA
jgi:drug/metabolite transporter (DMT)-like permease